jgi:hypothetical protein
VVRKEVEKKRHLNRKKMVTQIDDNIALRLLYDVRLREINVIWL